MSAGALGSFWACSPARRWTGHGAGWAVKGRPPGGAGRSAEGETPRRIWGPPGQAGGAMIASDPPPLLMGGGRHEALCRRARSTLISPSAVMRAAVSIVPAAPLCMHVLPQGTLDILHLL